MGVLLYLVYNHQERSTQASSELHTLAKQTESNLASLLDHVLPVLASATRAESLSEKFVYELELALLDPSHDLQKLEETVEQIERLNDQFDLLRTENSAFDLASLKENSLIIEAVGYEFLEETSVGARRQIYEDSINVLRDVSESMQSIRRVIERQSKAIQARQVDRSRQLDASLAHQQQRQREVTQNFLTLFIVALLLVMLLQTMFFVALSRRTRLLGAYSLRIGQEEYGPPPFRSADPLGTLALQLEQLGQTKKQLLEDLKEKNAAIQSAKDRAEKMAFYDPLTALGNRRLFQQELSHTLSAFHRHREPFCLMYLDLDGFKQVNDSLGHDAGDELLKQVSARLRATVRAENFIARLGGDEFAIISDTQAAGGALLAERLLASIAASYTLKNGIARISTSIGIVPVETEAKTGEEIMRNADLAMYKSKQSGRNQYHFYQEDMDRAAKRNLQLRLRLRDAAEHPEAHFHLVFQPKVSLTSQRVVGYEALLRWELDGELVSPAEFVPLAEGAGFIIPISEWALQSACAAAIELADRQPDVSMAVNLSARQLYNYDLLQLVSRTLEETGLRADLLHLEVTETMMLHSLADAERILHQLVSLGVKISIDDFGTGFSSLAYLQRFPAQSIKVDRSFVGGMERNEKDAIIVEASIQLAERFGMKVISEGVETQAQARMLRTMGCELAQGFLFCKPQPLAYFLQAGEVRHFVS